MELPQEQHESLTIRSDHGIEYTAKIAGLGARSYAFVIDWHIRVLVAALWVLIVIIALMLMGLSTDSQPVLTWLPPALVYILYHPVIELYMQGNTPGKRYANVCVVMLTGGVPSTKAILMRNLMRLLDSLPLLYLIGIVACFVTRHQRRLGDIAAGTLLIYDESEKSDESEKASPGPVSLQPPNGRYSAGQLQTVSTVLSRWADLDKDKKEVLGRELLKKLDISISASAGVDAIHRKLQSISSPKE